VGLGSLSVTIGANATNIDGSISAAYLSMAQSVVYVIAAVLAILVVGSVDLRQQEKWRRMQTWTATADQAV
jgi:hypothetical protein